MESSYREGIAKNHAASKILAEMLAIDGELSSSTQATTDPPTRQEIKASIQEQCKRLQKSRRTSIMYSFVLCIDFLLVYCWSEVVSSTSIRFLSSNTSGSTELPLQYAQDFPKSIRTKHYELISLVDSVHRHVDTSGMDVTAGRSERSPMALDNARFPLTL
jgi:hypothetical protein